MSQTILVVDDDEMTRRILKLYCMRNDYDVVEAENGQEAISIIERDCPNLAIIDGCMPVLNGYETVRQIRTKFNCTNLPILFFSAKGDIEAENQSLEAGAQRFISKPINLGELMMNIKELTRSHLKENPN